MTNPYVSDERLKNVLKGYFASLGTSGYVSKESVSRILVYLFILDFIDSFAYFIEEKDYNLISHIYRKIFSDGGCLMPYPVYSTKRATMGLSTLIGDFRFRRTELDSYDTTRITENDIDRIMP